MTLQTENPTVVRTGRGLTIKGTRKTLYQVMDYVKADYPKKLIRDRMDLTDEQINDVMDYIESHREEVEAEYEQVLREAEEERKYWEERNRERLEKIAAERTFDIRELRDKLREEKRKRLSLL